MMKSSSNNPKAAVPWIGSSIDQTTKLGNADEIACEYPNGDVFR